MVVKWEEFGRKKLPGWTEGNHEHPEYGQSVFWTRFETTPLRYKSQASPLHPFPDKSAFISMSEKDKGPGDPVVTPRTTWGFVSAATFRQPAGSILEVPRRAKNTELGDRRNTFQRAKKLATELNTGVRFSAGTRKYLQNLFISPTDALYICFVVH